MTPRPSPRARIDWGAARAFFVALDPPRTRAAVARRFGVSEAAVRTHAKEEGWDEIAQEADTKAAERALANAVKTREQRTAQLLRIYDAAADRVELGVRGEEGETPELELDAVFAKFPEIHRIYRLEIGEATDQVAVAEVQAGFRTAMAVAVATAEEVASEMLKSKSPAFVREFRARFLPAVNEALAIGGGES